MTNDLSYRCYPKLDTYVDVAVYECSQHADSKSNKWVVNDARYRGFKLENIYSFREATESDKKNYMISDDNTIVPTEYCMMDGFDEWEKKRVSLMVVGNAEELNKRLNLINSEVDENYKKLYEWFDNK